jgi:opacity protein-like surface antigen
LGGYRLNRYLAAEVSYIDWGEVTAAGTVVSSGTAFDIAASQYSYGIAAVASLEIAAGFSVFGKLGFLRNEQETRRISPNPLTVNREDTGIHYGAGARYAIGPTWAVRGEWENTEKLEVQLLSIGVEYRF